MLTAFARPNKDGELTAGRNSTIRQHFCDIFNRSTDDLLVQLGELAADHDLKPRRGLPQFIEQLPDPVR